MDEDLGEIVAVDNAAAAGEPMRVASTLHSDLGNPDLLTYPMREMSGQWA
jgi:hypothetical protein